MNKLDLMNTESLVNLFLNEEIKNIQNLKKEKKKITKALKAIEKKISLGGRVIYIGAGTSGRLGLLDAVECKPTFNTDGFIGIIAGGENAFIQAKEGAEDETSTAIKDLKKYKLSKKDILIGIAASGETPYTTSAIKYGNKIKCLTISITSNPKSTLSKIADHTISPHIEKEIIQGSSRLKSGTAQKIILNMISSISMIKSGKVYDDLMIDVLPTNKKLVKRAITIIATICNISFAKAEELFKNSNMHTKEAIVSYKFKCNSKNAKRLLNKNKDNVRKTISQN